MLPYETYMIRIALLAIMFVLAPSFFSEAIAGDVRERLAATTPWNVDYSNDSCRLMRGFGPEKSRITLILQRFGPGDYFRLTLQGQRFKRARTGLDIRFQFGQEEMQEREYKPAVVGGIPALQVKWLARIAKTPHLENKNFNSHGYPKFAAPAEIQAISNEQKHNADVMLIEPEGQDDFLLELGSLEKPLAALDICIKDLIGNWPIDVEKHQNLGKRAAPNGYPQSWLSRKDYPYQEARQFKEAAIYARLTIDATGAVSDCDIQEALGSKAFVLMTCNRLKHHGSYSPALDQNGEQIASYSLIEVWFDAGQKGAWSPWLYVHILEYPAGY